MNVFHGSAVRSWAVVASSVLIVGTGQAIRAQAVRHNVSAAPAPRQERGDRSANAVTASPPPPEVEPESAAQRRELGETVAILPWNYKNSRDAAVQSAHEVCSQLLLGTGFNVFLIKTAAGAMPPPMSGVSGSKKQASAFTHLQEAGRNLVTQDAPKKAGAVFVLPTPDEMLAVGERLHTRYVLAGRAQWRSRNVWIGVSNRIKSICSVDLGILDMNTRQFVLDAHGVEGDSTENKNLYNAFTNIMALNPLPLMMPGSVGPYEQRAVTVAIARAMHPWLKKERIRAALDQADASREAALDNRPTSRFSALLSPLKDLQAGLHVTIPDGKSPQWEDKELARLCVLHDLTFQYQEPNRMRLSGASPKAGKETLILNEEQRSFAAGEDKTVSYRNFSGAPTRRIFLFELCGLLTPGLFDTLRARFVKQETLDGTPTLVYDLTYWGLDDGPYHRIWIDPARRLIVKRERFDADSKRKWTVLYKQPIKVSPDLWIPGMVEIQDSHCKGVMTITITKPRVDVGIPASAFAAVSP